jgi:hypothetical protein
MPTARKRSRTGARQQDALGLLKKDHATVKGLLKRFAATSERATEQRKTLLNQIETEIKNHSRIEEEIFYPAYKDAVRSSDEHIYYESLEEHHLVDIVLAEIKTKGYNSEEFGAKAKVLKDLIEHHAEEEEKEMFPIARKAMKREQLRELGQRMKARKEGLAAPMLTRVAMTAGRTMGKVFNRNKRAATTD